MKLADICEINPRAELLDDNTLVSFVAMPDVSEDGKINVDTHRAYGEVKKGFTNFKEGDVLFAKITPCMENGKGALATGLENGLGFGSTEFHVLRPNAAIVLGEWLYYLTSWSAFRKDAEKHMTGSAGQKRVPKSFLEKYEVDVPPTDDQEYQVLQLNRIRKIIDARRQQLSALDDLIKARFVEMFGAHRADCCSMRIGDYAKVLGGYAFKSDEFVRNAVPVIRISNINNGEIKPDYTICFDEQFWRDNPRFRALPGDILMAMSGAKTGKAGILRSAEPLLINQRVACIRAKEANAVPEFIFAATQLPWMSDLIQEQSAGCAQPNISGKQIENMPIPRASINQQRGFAAFVAQIDESKSVIQKSLDETQLLYDSLMQKYFG